MLTNMFISIIVDNFNKLRQEQLKQQNEVELIQFMMTKTKRWLGTLTLSFFLKRKEANLDVFFFFRSAIIQRRAGKD